MVKIKVEYGKQRDCHIYRKEFDSRKDFVDWILDEQFDNVIEIWKLEVEE